MKSICEGLSGSRPRDCTQKKGPAKGPWPRGNNHSAILVSWLLLACFLLWCPCRALAADIEVLFQSLTVLAGGGFPKAAFLPGEEIQVRVNLLVLRSTGNPVAVRLRIAGKGWHEIRAKDILLVPGVRSISFGGAGERLYAAAGSGPGKVSLVADVFSEQETVSLRGTRHAYLEIRCPDGLLSGTAARLQVGIFPQDMALTDDGRFLYVTSREDRNVTVIDVEARTVVTVIDETVGIGLPAGVAFWPVGRKVLVADSGLQAIHVIDADAHVFVETIPLNPEGDFGEVYPGDLAVNPARNEVYIADARRARIFSLNLASRLVREISLLAGFATPPAGLRPIQLKVDPDNSRFVYALCQAFNEIVKVDVATGGIADYVRFANTADPSSLWPVWSMAVNPVTDEIYVVATPGGFESTYITMESKIYVVPKNWLGGPGRREFRTGFSVWDLAVREDGRYVYGIDSYLGGILVIDPNGGISLERCAIPVEPGGRLLLADPARDRMFVGSWAPGYADIVE